MRRLAAVLLPLLLAGCGMSPALIGAGLGLLSGELKLGTAVLGYMTAREARPPDCSTTAPPPCVVLPGPTAP